MNGRLRNSKIAVEWSPLQRGVMNFNVDGASRGKLGLTEIGSVLRDHSGQTSLVFTESMGLEIQMRPNYLVSGEL